MIPGRKKQERDKQYYSDNKEEIKDRESLQIKCTKCRAVVRKKTLLRHQRTIKCQSTADILLELDELN